MVANKRPTDKIFEELLGIIAQIIINPGLWKPVSYTYLRGLVDFIVEPYILA